MKGMTSDGSIVKVLCTDTSTGQQVTMSSKFVVACDGAHSLVRKSIQDAEAKREAGMSAWGVRHC